MLSTDVVSFIAILVCNNDYYFLFCSGPRDTHPPPSVVVPQEPRITIPGGLSCGSVKVATGSSSFTSPGYPSQLFNQKCAFVLKAPEGYGLEVSLPGFQQDPT